MSSGFILIVFSVLLGVLCVRWLRRYDIHEKEPLWAMLAVAVWGGAWAVLFALAGYWGLALAGFGNITSQLGPLLIIGPIEESAKLIALLTSYPIIRRELDEPTDGMIYMACVALGFSLIENYFYAVGIENGHFLILVRLAICTPMHILFSVFMGLAFYLVQREKAPTRLLLFALLYSSAMHGMYDLAVFNAWSFWVVIVVAWVAYWWVMKWLEYTTARSPHRLSLAEFVRSQEEPPVEVGLECPNCGSAGDKPTYRNGKISFQKCDCCPCYVVKKKSLFALFRHYGSVLRRPGRYYTSARSLDLEFSVLHAGNQVSERTGIGFFRLDEFDAALEDINLQVAERHEKSPFIRRLLSA